MPARERVVAALAKWQRAQVGTREKPRGSNKQPYGRRYGWNGVAWCVIYQWCGAQAIGLASKYWPKTASVAALRSWARQQGRYGRTPKVGAVGLYPSGSSHATWVEKILADGYVQTIEGNTNDDGSREGYEVARRRRKAASFDGFFYPRYAMATLPDRSASSPKPVGKPSISRILKLRDPWMRGADVKRLQRKIGVTADGVFGSKTDKAVKAFQEKHGLTADGEVGPKTAEALGITWKR